MAKKVNGRDTVGITPDDFKKKLRNGEFPSLVFLDGDEPYIKKNIIETIIKRTVSDKMPDFNLRVFEGADCSADELVLSVQTMPFMGERTCTIVRDFDAGVYSQDDFSVIKDLLTDLPEFVTLVFYYSDKVESKQSDSEEKKENNPEAGKQRNAFKKLLYDKSTVVACNKLSGNDTTYMIINGAKRRGFEITRDTAESFVNYVGNDLNLLLNELEKLCSFAKDGTITNDDIRNICTRSLEASVFDIAENIFKYNAQKAMMTLYDLFAQKEDPIKIFGALTTMFIDVYRLKTAANNGFSPENVAEVFNCSAYRLKKANQNVSKVSLEVLRSSLSVLSNTDLILKSMYEDNNIILERTVLQLLMLQ